MNRRTADLIKEFREARAWTQEELARNAGLGVRTIQRAESGENLQSETLRALSATFNVNVSDLKAPSAVSGPPQNKNISAPIKTRTDRAFNSPRDEVLRRLYAVWVEDSREGGMLEGEQVFEGLDDSLGCDHHILLLEKAGLMYIDGTGPLLRLTAKGAIELERQGLAPQPLHAQCVARRERFLTYLCEQYEKSCGPSYASIQEEVGLTWGQYYATLDALDWLGVLQGDATYPELTPDGYEVAKALLEDASILVPG